MYQCCRAWSAELPTSYSASGEAVAPDDGVCAESAIAALVDEAVTYLHPRDLEVDQLPCYVPTSPEELARFGLADVLPAGKAEVLKAIMRQQVVWLVIWGGEDDKESETEAARAVAALLERLAELTAWFAQLGPRAEGRLELILDHGLDHHRAPVEEFERQLAAAGSLNGHRPKPGRPVAAENRNLALHSLMLFDTYRPMEAKKTSGDFPLFLDLIYEAARKREPGDLSRHIDYAFSHPERERNLKHLPARDFLP